MTPLCIWDALYFLQVRNLNTYINFPRNDVKSTILLSLLPLVICCSKLTSHS